MSSNNLKTEIPRWWSRRRLRYNKGLLISLLIAITLYFILAHEMISGFEITAGVVEKKLLFGLFFLLAMNVLYIIGAMIDTRLNQGGMERVSVLLWNIVYWGSVIVPFVMPGLILADRYDLYTPLGL